MPIRLLSLPIEDLQYVLNSMDICDLIAFSLCSKQTKNLVKSSNRKIEIIRANIDEKCIHINIRARNQNQNYETIVFNFTDSWLEIDRHRRKITFWTKQEFTRSIWIAHFISIFKVSMVQLLIIGNASLSYLDTIKQCIPKCQKLIISALCTNNVARMAFLKLAPISEEVKVEKDIFDNKNDISKLLTLNLKSATFTDPGFPFKLTLDNLSILNITYISINPTNITEKELNRFLKLWMKGNHRFYRPKYLRLYSRNELNREEVLRGIKNEIVDFELRLKRADGKELCISIGWKHVILEF